MCNKIYSILIIYILVISLSGRQRVFAGKCGTPDLFHRLQELASSTEENSVIAAARTAVNRSSVPARTYLTDNFAIHYVMKGADKVLFTPEDTELINEVEGLYADLEKEFNEPELSLRIYAILDSLDVGHPRFIEKQGYYFEKAYTHYIGDLGMKIPEVNSSSFYFREAAIKNKYHIEIANIASTDSYWIGQEVYALTYPSGGIITDNDFLYTLRGGQLDTIRSSYTSVSPPLIINYATDWEKGIQVTAAHEYYHAIQYQYTPNPSSYHFWYELSAVGMEERLASDVNDYLQYLPDLFSKHASFSLNNQCFNCTETYGNGIFHVFLSSELGDDFDVSLWKSLNARNNIESAFNKLTDEYSVNLPDLYARYTQPLLFSQKSEDSPFFPFSDDLFLWPAIKTKTLTLDASAQLIFSLPSMTFEAVRLEGLSSLLVNKIEVENGEDLTLTFIYDGQSSEKRLKNNVVSFSFTMPEKAGTNNYLLFSNGAWDKTAKISITLVIDEGVVAFPNPYQSERDDKISFTRPLNADSLTSLFVYSEFGIPVKELNFLEENVTWDWNVRDDKGDVLSAGIYYYGPKAGPVKPFVIMNKNK
ncbi:MAG: hypothetical protein HQK83_18650 [Fibrobacteria bacterium]|nr:hypothetical protein [Fibrobacteria bacterium]